MLAAAGSIFGLFFLCSVYLQDVLGTGPLMTGLAFIPLAFAAGVGAHAAGHVVGRHGVRMPLASAFAIAAVGMALLAHVGENGTYLRNVLPGMLVAGFGLGIAVVSVSIAVLTGAREEESGMISGLGSTGHEIGGTIGIAVFSTIAAGARARSAAPRPPRRSRTRSWRPGSWLASRASPPSSSSRRPGTSSRSSASTPPRCRFTEMAEQTTPAKPQRRRRADADRSVQAILEAALDALAGDPDASMAEIARRAGVVRATIYAHFPTREALLDAVMEHAVGAGRRGDGRGRADARRAAAKRWCGCSARPGGSSTCSMPCSRSTRRGSPPEELHRRHLPVMTQFAPLIERGQEAGVFRRDVPFTWHLAVMRAIVHAASAELRSGRLTEATVEQTMLTTVLAAIAAPKR